MKKIIAALVASALLLSACSSSRTIDGRTYEPYGVATVDTKKANNICYSMSTGDVILGLIFIETLIVPIYILGWDLMEPSGKKIADGTCQPD